MKTNAAFVRKEGFPFPLLSDDRREVDREFANIFVCRFDGDGRCREFTEYYMRRRPEAEPDEPPPAA